MKKLIAIATLAIVSTFAAFAQSDKEKEVLQLAQDLNQAYLKKDVAFIERHLAPDYILATEVGTVQDRTKELEWVRKEKANPTFTVLSSKPDDLRVRVMGDVAVVTGSWTMQTTQPGAAPAEPHTDTGRFTHIYEKRGGKWLLVTEHFSEAQHDRKLMEQQVLKIGQEYARMIKNQDGATIERMLADEYLFTNERGKTKNKAEDLADYKNRPAKFEIFEIADQKVRVIGNNAAVETGTVRFKGASHDGKPFDGSERYTTTWVNRIHSS